MLNGIQYHENFSKGVKKQFFGQDEPQISIKDNNWRLKTVRSQSGYGTVGSGVVEVYKYQPRAASAEKQVKKSTSNMYLDLRDFPGDPIQEKIVHDYDIILNDPESPDRCGGHGRCGTGLYFHQKGTSGRKECLHLQ